MKISIIRLKAYFVYLCLPFSTRGACACAQWKLKTFFSYFK